ncbi:hypothetical protein AN216_20640 [Streptomyces oceani]|uniref:Ester cyclase n=2 Tax=Streptomyces oceani TaxID=1075402 RepID=A0A1E7JXT9_9ACTN|nr:hypothetical protein AN216_20640 [Streptomyces oceani]
MRTTFDAFNAGDLAACTSRMASEFVINLAGAPTRYGQDVWQQGVDIMRQGFPDMQAHIEDVFGSGDRVAMRLTFRGTHTGEFQGIPATGREVSYTSNEIYRVEDGVIAEEWICSDMAGLMAQLR